MIDHSEAVDPGSVGTLRIRVDPTGKKGRLVQTAILYTDQPQMRQLRFAISMVCQNVWLNRRVVDLGAMTLGEQGDETVFLLQAGHESMRVVEAESSQGLFEVKRVSARQNEELVRSGIATVAGFQLHLKEDAPLGLLRDTLRVVVHSEDGDKTVECDIRATCSGYAEITPSEVFFGTLHENDHAKMACKVVTNTGVGQEWLSSEALVLTTSHPFVHAEWKDVRAEVWTFELVIFVDSDTPKGMVQGSVESSIAGQALLSVPYRAFVQ